MRVIAGIAKRIQLQTLDGMDTRPTTDRIKETLFNMIAPSLYDCNFLDLFAGSGSIGIEALSRGAREVVFVEKQSKAMACIKQNLMHTKLGEHAHTISADAMTALRRMEGKKEFDYIFMDPPYHQLLEKSVLTYLTESSLLAKDGVIIVEAAKETGFEYLDALGFHLLKEKIYKTNKHVFIDCAERKAIC